MHSCESIAHTKLHWGRDNMQLSNVQYLHQSKQNGSFREEGYGAFRRRTTCCSGKGKWFRQRCACYYLGDLWIGESLLHPFRKKKKIQTKAPPPCLRGKVWPTWISYLHRDVWVTDQLDFTVAFESSKSHHLLHADNDFLLPSNHFRDHFWELKKKSKSSKLVLLVFTFQK